MAQWAGRLHVAVGMTACLVLTACAANNTDTSPAAAGAVAVAMNAPPWGRPNDTAEAVKAAGLQLAANEALDDHLHVRLNVFYEGKPVTVPEKIGVAPGLGAAPINTQDDSGTVHVKRDAAQRYTLGQFFTEWDVPLTGAQVTVNGKPVGDAKSLILADKQTITVRYLDPAPDTSVKTD